nr:MAG: hypothetical protein DIU67_07610 [Actinomycetota bacterium]
MTGEAVSIRLEPTLPSVAMSRIFIVSVLAAAGADDTTVENARVFISDVSTGLVSEGAEILIEARFADGGASLGGNLPGLVPEAGSLLLGDLLEISENRWTLTVPTR